MTSLYRCRTALSEVRDVFSTNVPTTADWSAEVWPGRTALIVRGANGARRAETSPWGLLDEGQRVSASKRRTTVWFREVYPEHRAWLEPEGRCLIVVDSFAYPEGPAGAVTRTWFGIDAQPIFAWAGIWRPSGFCGFVVAANECVAPGNVMPALVDPANYATWLDGDLAEASLIARRPYPAEGMYREPTEEPWGGDRTI